MLTKPQPYLIGDLRAEAIDLVVGAVDADDVGPVDAGAEDLGPFEIGGDEDVALQPGGGGVGGDAVGEVARRGAADRREAELARLAQGDGDDAVLERQRREVDGVVLDPQLLDAELVGQAVGPDQRRAADVQADGRLAVEGQQFLVAPHVERAQLDLLAAERLADGVVVVIDFERAEIVGAEVGGVMG